MNVLLTIWNAIPGRAKLGILLAVAFIFGLMRWKNQKVDEAIERVRNDQLEKRIENFEKAKEIENEVEALPDDELRRRAGKWVRAPQRTDEH